jgi:hypothetical protein
MQADIESMLEQTRVAAADHRAEILEYLRSFPHIILRGAGHFGSAFGASLIHMGIEKGKMRYQDIRAGVLRELNGIPVEHPGSEGARRAPALVINCIPNGSSAETLGKRLLEKEGYRRHLSGMALFEALMCKLGERDFDANVCIRTKSCNWCACKRLSALLGRRNVASPRDVYIHRGGGGLLFPVLSFVLNQKCTLACRHCGQYMNHYPPRERVNFSLRRIQEDIDRASETVDAAGFISLIGGEPFLHPDLDRIIMHVFSKKNFGVLGVTTNGVCRMGDTALDALRAGPARVIFSDYTPALDEKQKKLFLENVERVASRGISHTVGQPLWGLPPTLRDQRHSGPAKTALKSACTARAPGRLVCNGAYYACSIAYSLDSLHLESHDEDKVILARNLPAQELRQRILALEQRGFFDACGYCGEEGKTLKISGEQGDSARYEHLHRWKKQIAPAVHQASNIGQAADSAIQETSDQPSLR